MPVGGGGLPLGILREQGARHGTADVHGIRQCHVLQWKARYGGLQVSDARRLRKLEDENANREELLAEAMLDNAILKDAPQKKSDTSERQWITPVQCTG
jgi:putative transposase